MSRKHGTAQTLERPQERLTARPNEIMTRAPLRAAYAQMRPGEEQSCQPLLKTVLTWDGPPKMRRVPGAMPDFTGKRYGALVVKGLLDMTGWPGKQGGKWVVRCDCGMWETRTSKTLRLAKAPHDCCVYCRTVVNRKREAERTSYFNRNGRWPDGSWGQEIRART